MMIFFCNFPLMGTLKYENCGLSRVSPVIFLWWELIKYWILKSNSSLKIWELWLIMIFSCDFPLMETDKILNSQIKFFFNIWKMWLMMSFPCDFRSMENEMGKEMDGKEETGVKRGEKKLARKSLARTGLFVRGCISFLP